MAETISVTTETGSTSVECYWKNDVLAVTRHIGVSRRDGTEVPPVDGGWTITHLRSGRCLGTHGWDTKDPERLKELAQYLTPVVPWGTLPLRALLGNLDIREKVVDAARAFWASREPEGR